MALTRIRHGELVRRNTCWLKRVGQSLSRNGRWPPPASGRSLRVDSIWGKRRINNGGGKQTFTSNLAHDGNLPDLFSVLLSVSEMELLSVRNCWWSSSLSSIATPSLTKCQSGSNINNRFTLVRFIKTSLVDRGQVGQMTTASTRKGLTGSIESGGRGENKPLTKEVNKHAIKLTGYLPGSQHGPP